MVPRQVNRDELAYQLVMALRKLPRSTLKLLTDSRITERHRAEAVAAMQLVDALGRYEVLSTIELPRLMGETTYSVPIARMLGEDLPSGVVPALVEPCSKHG